MSGYQHINNDSWGGLTIMHNLVSHNELADWKVGKTDDVESDSNYELMSDYFQCLTECDTSDHDAKRFCRHILE